jgi:hypothetical protein
MRLAIVHYHLRRGGVTRVIANALAALGDRVEAVVLASTESAEPLPCPVLRIPELAYGDEASADAARRLHRRLRQAARDHFGADADLWHIHNHSLGKQVNFPEALRRLLDGGARALLQIHDFAEDGRPGNYAAQRAPYREGVFAGFEAALYPDAPQVAYAVLNARDRDILARAGLARERLHLLPNAVAGMPGAPAEGPPAAAGGRPPLVLYPTRAIRRKNVGELLLLAALYPEFRYATTLAPENPEWRAIHDAWVALARELRLPVAFAAAQAGGPSFADLVGEAAMMVSTSVGEGFGLAFLEPWLAGKPVIGRDLPAITADFKDNGVALPDLYPEWPVPVGMVDRDGLRRRFSAAATALHAAYGRQLGAADCTAAFARVTRDGRVDFGRLDEPAQAQALRAVVSSRQRQSLRAPVDPRAVDTAPVAANAARIRAVYGLDRYGARLAALYDGLLAAPAGDIGALDPDRILDAFIDPADLRLLRA